MGLGRSIREWLFSYQMYRPMRIDYMPLGIAQSLTYALAAAYILWAMFSGQEYLTNIETQHLFDVLRLFLTLPHSAWLCLTLVGSGDSDAPRRAPVPQCPSAHRRAPVPQCPSAHRCAQFPPPWPSAHLLVVQFSTSWSNVIVDDLEDGVITPRTLHTAAVASLLLLPSYCCCPHCCCRDSVHAAV